jgi:conjugal transfer pilus assembly protein TraF
MMNPKLTGICALALCAALGMVQPAAAQSTALEAPAAPATPSSAAAVDYCARDLGTWFYCNRELAEPPPAATETHEKPSPSAEELEIAKFEKFKVELERVEKLAVWNPTPENVERFYRMQRKALNQSSLFSDVYRRLVWERPDLDYTLKRPVNEIGKREWGDTRAVDRELFLNKVAPKIGLFYVFRGNCGPCHVFSPIMRDFANRYAITVRGVSMDGSRNDDISTSFVDHGQLRSWGVDNPTTPSILMFQDSSLDPQTGDVRPTNITLSDGKVVEVTPCMKPSGCVRYIGAGVMSQEDIAERIYVMLATRPGEDF